MPAKERELEKYLNSMRDASGFSADPVGYLQTVDRSTLPHAKALWFFGQWDKLQNIDIEQNIQHPDFPILALLKACGFQQNGEDKRAEQWIRIALKCGCDLQLVTKLILAGLHQLLARVYLANGNQEKAKEHISLAVDTNLDGIDRQFGAQVRLAHEMSALGLLDDAASVLTEQTRCLEQEEADSRKQSATLTIVKSELDLVNHQLMLALQRNQLYKKSKRKRRKPESSAVDTEELKRLSTSQLSQDLWVLEKTGYKRNGFFVEFGATDGVLLSNTYLLEKEFGWRGICAEPNPEYFEKLKRSRNCIVDDACIYSESGHELDFVLANEFGGVEKEAVAGLHAERVSAYRNAGEMIRVTTISLDDFLRKHGAPREIDYLSIDTEGSEYQILSTFPFDEWDVKILTIEHNFEPQREKTRRLLNSFGYNCQESQWDDWYSK